MQRSCSWPQLTQLENGNDFCGCGPNKIMDLLHEKLSNFGSQSYAWDSKLQLLEEEQKGLQIQNINLLRRNTSYSEEILILESERNEYRIQVEELQALLTDLQKDLRQAEMERKIVSEEWKIQQKAIIDIERSKKELEKQLIMSREALQLQKDEINNTVIHEASMESDFLRQQVQSMKQKLDEKTYSEELKVLRNENKEMQTQICELVQKNVILTRQLGEMQQCIDHWEQRNLEVQVELDRMKVDGVNSTMGDSENLAGPHLTSLADEIGEVLDVRTLCIADEIDEVLSPKLTESLRYIKTHDALEEFIQISASAVKICFPNVWVSSKELIQKAKTVPFYHVHEVLHKFLSEKSQQQKVCRREVCRQEALKKAKI